MSNPWLDRVPAEHIGRFFDHLGKMIFGPLAEPADFRLNNRYRPTKEPETPPLDSSEIVPETNGDKER